MRKIAVVQLTLAVALVAASLGVVPGADAKKRKEDVVSTDESNGNNDVRQTADNDNDNNLNNNNNNNNNNNVRATAGEYDDKRFAAVRYDELPAAESGGPTSAQQAKAVAKQSSKQHNAKLLNRLGMKRIRTGGGSGSAAAGGTGSGANHHRKRLASQSRSKYGNGNGGGGADGKSTSDSQMFIVKLPPHSHFYDDGSPAAATHQRPSSSQQQSHHNNNNNINNNKLSPYKSLNTVPVGFVSNGKPAKVYHWNLPTIKHALQGGGGRYKGVNDVVAMQQQQQHHHHHHQQQQQMHHHQLQQQQQYNQAMQDFELPSVAAGSKIVPRRTLYYKPRASGKPVKKSFVNNGKPNGFYVVSSKNAAAAPQYHKIVKAYYGSGDD